jgi:threonyl-tRNA synthetase
MLFVMKAILAVSETGLGHPRRPAIRSYSQSASPLVRTEAVDNHLQKEYASEVAASLTAQGLFVDVDNGADTLPKKIRNGEVAQYNFLLGTSGFPSSNLSKKLDTEPLLE